MGMAWRTTRALDAGVKFHGATVHFVTAELDHGPIIDQACVRIEQGDTEDTLAQKLLIKEHQIYPRAVRLFVEGKLVVEGNRVIVNGSDADSCAI